jgi:hypothetical protein
MVGKRTLGSDGNWHAAGGREPSAASSRTRRRGVSAKLGLRLTGMILGVCLAGCLALPAGAAARIVVNRSIDGVRIGASMAHVKHLLGEPNDNFSCTGIVPGPCGPGEPEPGSKPAAERFWDYTRRQLDVFFWHHKVQAVTTMSAHERTNRGIGPGVTVRHMKHVYRRGAIAPFSGAQGWWLPGRPKKNALFTVFVGSPRNHPTKLGGKLDSVEVGRWLGNSYGCYFYDC